MNLSLRNARLPAAFADWCNLRPGMGQRKYFLRNEIVGKNHISRLKKPQDAQRFPARTKASPAAPTMSQSRLPSG